MEYVFMETPWVTGIPKAFGGSGDPSPYTAHGVLMAHVARANAVWQSAGASEALVVFQGPAGYITPAWYPSKQAHGKAVPTWNYVVVHAYGAVRLIEDRQWLRAHVSTLTNTHEADRVPAWKITDAPADYIDRMLEAIVGVEITITRLIGKWKVSQNRTAADRAGVVSGLQDERGDIAMAGLVRERDPG